MSNIWMYQIVFIKSPQLIQAKFKSAVTFLSDPGRKHFYLVPKLIYTDNMNIC